MDDSVTPSTAAYIGQVYQFLDKFREITGDSKMPLQQVMTLLALYVHPTIMQTELEKYTGVSKTSISRNLALLGIGLDPIQSPGPEWVAPPEADPMNRKFNIVRLTPKGRALLEVVAREVLKQK